MLRLVISYTITISLLGCGRCGSEAPGGDARGEVAEPIAPEAGESGSQEPAKIPAEAIATDAMKATDAGAIDVAPGPDDCWASGDVIELQLDPRGFPVKGLKFEGPDCDGELEAAASRGDLAAVRSMIEKVRIPDHWPARSPRCRTAELGSLLHLGVASGSTQLVEYLVSKGLIDKGALVDAIDIEGNRPLHRCFDNRFLRPARPDIDPARLEDASELAGFLVGAGAKNIQNWIPER